MNVENQDKLNSSELIRREQRIGSPFWDITTEEGIFMVMGKHKITPKFETQQELDEHVDKHKWDIMAQMTIIIVQKELEGYEQMKNSVNQSIVEAMRKQELAVNGLPKQFSKEILDSQELAERTHD